MKQTKMTIGMRNQELKNKNEKKTTAQLLCIAHQKRVIKTL